MCRLCVVSGRMKQEDLTDGDKKIDELTDKIASLLDNDFHITMTALLDCMITSIIKHKADINHSLITLVATGHQLYYHYQEMMDKKVN